MGIWHTYRITYINGIYNTAIVSRLIIVCYHVLIVLLIWKYKNTVVTFIIGSG